MKSTGRERNILPGLRVEFMCFFKVGLDISQSAYKKGSAACMLCLPSTLPYNC